MEIVDGEKTTDDDYSMDAILQIAAIIGNIVHIGFVCRALVDQYPHPAEEDFIPYVLMTVLLPILSPVVILRSGTKVQILQQVI